MKLPLYTVRKRKGQKKTIRLLGKITEQDGFHQIQD